LSLRSRTRASYRRIVERIAGTFAGVFAAWMITMGFHSVAVVCACILVVAPLVPHHLANRYWLHTALIALLVSLAYDLAELDAQGIAKLLPERVIDMFARLRHGAGWHRCCFSADAGCRTRQLDR
jgi:uncharacterized membrane protein YccC